MIGNYDCLAKKPCLIPNCKCGRGMASLYPWEPHYPIILTTKVSPSVKKLKSNHFNSHCSDI